MIKNIQKWLLSIFAIIGAFFTCGLGGAFLAESLNIWSVPVAGFLAAFSVVTVAYLSAPLNPRAFASAVFVVGASIAFYLLNDEVYPDSYQERAYLHTWLPYLTTLIGGLVSMVIIFYPKKL